MHEFLSERLNQCNREIQEAHSKKEHYEELHREAQQEEVINSQGIMNGSIFTVNVVEARDLKAMDYDGTSDPYVVIRSSKEEAMTRPQRNTLNPIWEEEFQFEVADPGEIVQIQVFDKDFEQNSEDTFLGSTEIMLRDLDDQMINEKWYTLNGPDTFTPWSGRIQLTCRWVHSKVKLYSALARIQKGEIEEQVRLREDFHTKLDDHRSPFWWMEGDQIRELHADDENYNTTMQQKLGTVGQGERSMSSKVDRTFRNVVKNKTSWIKCGLYFLFIFMLPLQLFICSYRTDFMNLCVLAGIIYLFMFPLDLKKWVLRLFLVCLLVNQIQDIFWCLVQYHRWHAEHRDERHFEFLYRQAILIAVLIYFLMKFVLMFLIWKISVDYLSIISTTKKNHEIQVMADKQAIIKKKKEREHENRKTDFERSNPEYVYDGFEHVQRDTYRQSQGQRFFRTSVKN